MKSLGVFSEVSKSLAICTTVGEVISQSIDCQHPKGSDVSCAIIRCYAAVLEHPPAGAFVKRDAGEEHPSSATDSICISRHYFKGLTSV